MKDCVYMWSGEEGVRGWRVEVTRSQLSCAMGKLAVCRAPCSSVTTSWPLTPKEPTKCAESASVQEYLNALVSRAAVSKYACGVSMYVMSVCVCVDSKSQNVYILVQHSTFNP